MEFQLSIHFLSPLGYPGAIQSLELTYTHTHVHAQHTYTHTHTEWENLKSSISRTCEIILTTQGYSKFEVKQTNQPDRPLYLIYFLFFFPLQHYFITSDMSCEPKFQSLLDSSQMFKRVIFRPVIATTETVDLHKFVTYKLINIMWDILFITIFSYRN